MEIFNTPADFVQKLIDRIHEEDVELETLNVMILGKTGVGKSTLVNNMFREKVAEIGVGKPVTDKIRQYVKPDFPLTIYDTPGLELGGENTIEKLLEEAIGVIKQGIKSGEIGKAIHCIWYCVSTPSHRFEQSEVEFLKRFLDETEYFNVPVIVVLTQSYSKKDADELKKEIEKENLKIVNVVPVLAEDYYFDDEDPPKKAFGLDTLSEIMCSVIPEAVQKTFVAVQCVSLELKKSKARAAVKAAVAGSFAEGFAPLPFADAAMLIPTQVGMIAGITVIFGLDINKSFLTSFVTATIGSAGATVLGRTIVSNLVKLIPGVGTAAGGVISGATAGLLTIALGEAYIRIMEMVYKGEIRKEELYSEEGKDIMKQLFQNELKKKR
ncbi:MAG: 50S ribosome-binding GTPase [Clostridia bacterium]|nr:50S ribosome-binding GTPase [Clostridia bacterium]